MKLSEKIRHTTECLFSKTWIWWKSLHYKEWTGQNRTSFLAVLQKQGVEKSIYVFLDGQIVSIFVPLTLIQISIQCMSNTIQFVLSSLDLCHNRDINIYYSQMRLSSPTSHLCNLPPPEKLDAWRSKSKNWNKMIT